MKTEQFNQILKCDKLRTCKKKLTKVSKLTVINDPHKGSPKQHSTYRFREINFKDKRCSSTKPNPVE